MSWTSTTLSTPTSLAELEGEINNLALNSSVIDYIDNIGGTSDNRTLYANGHTALIGDCVRFSEYTTTTFLRNEIRCIDKAPTVNSIEFNSGSQFSGTPVVGDEFYIIKSNPWTGKITLAKEYLLYEVENFLKKTYGTLASSVYASGKRLIDLILDYTPLKRPSDYLVLSFIYNDLCVGNDTSPYAYKSKLYHERYKDFLDKAMQLLTIDIDLDGVADSYNPSITMNIQNFVR